MALDPLLTLSPGDVLEILKNHPLLRSYHLTLLQEPESDRDLRHFHPCGVIGDEPACQEFCIPVREEALRNALESRSPVVFDCPPGLLHFVIPFHAGNPEPLCLIAGGVRDSSVNPLRREFLARVGDEKGAAVLEQIEQRPVANRAEVEEVAARVTALIPTLLEKTLPALSLEKTVREIKAIAEVSRQFERASSSSEVITQISESLVVLFDLPRLAVILAEEGGRRFVIRGGLGLPEEVAGQVFTDISRIPRSQPGDELLAKDGEIAELFPGLPGSRVLGIPLVGGEQEIGMLVIVDADLHPRERLLARLLADRAAARLLALRQLQSHKEEKSVFRRLISMISSLSLMENREDLHHNIVEMAADLLQAASGSLMLLQEGAEALHIEFAKGMNLPLARSMTVPLGSGIAGKVARSGFPLLVIDIEKDARVGIANRPRFRTKSFISVPLKPRDTVIGVLNLADKETGSCFTEADLNLLSSFVDHAGIMIERTLRLERACLLEELSVTDPLTGLYNRRFLEKRLEEELSRSARHNLAFTVILLDLDHFKVYNDLCGHLAGDHALKRVSDLLRNSAREMDMITRFGGEEFCVLLPGTSKKESMFVAERIRRAIEKEAFPHEAKLPLTRLTASLGLASFPEDGVTSSNLIHAADIALYQAKNDGRNRLVLYDPSLRDQSRTGTGTAVRNPG